MVPSKDGVDQSLGNFTDDSREIGIDGSEVWPEVGYLFPTDSDYQLQSEYGVYGLGSVKSGYDP